MNDFKDQLFRSVEYTSFGEAQGHLASLRQGHYALV